MIDSIKKFLNYRVAPLIDTYQWSLCEMILYLCCSMVAYLNKDHIISMVMSAAFGIALVELRFKLNKKL